MEASNQRQAEQVWRRGEHLAELDGLRGFAILIVTLYRFGKEFPSETMLGKLIGGVLSQGDRGVDLFFVLSGFLITGILIDGKDRPHYFRNFIARRCLRIFPLYFCTLAAIVIGSRFVPELADMFALPLGNQFYLWTYLVNIKMSVENQWCFGYLDHFWSLAVEEHFYLVWPFILYHVRSARMLRVAITVAILSAVSRIVYVLISHHGIAADVLTIFRVDALLIGAAVAVMARNPQSLERLRPWLPIPFLSGVMVVASGLVFKKGWFTLPHTLWPMIWACILVWLMTMYRNQWMARFFKLAALRSLGKYSYAMYIFQNPLIPLMSVVLTATTLTSVTGDAVSSHLVYIGLMFALTYIAAIVSWYLLERHFLKLKKYFPTNSAV
ncbi:acyltransferase 3 [Rhodopirellula maiorica SM1]|uniref:Acyltransferase 3 n=1 Tax=Rhodopirellula maiorica SM1 TaxID=1265738 RepID=M5RUG7_9BACT|nr:acyltransferase [Rhodopirellula maiorica]EMI22816.1 acyltransferase 3 [Rhodopirellula maiorica SM1]